MKVLRFTRVEVDVSVGCSIDKAASAMSQLAYRSNCDVATEFNGIKLIATPGITPLQIVSCYHQTRVIKMYQNILSEVADGKG